MNTIALITGIIGLIEPLGKFYRSLVDQARQNAELTPEQEAEFQKRLDAAFASPHWQVQPDPTSTTDTR